MIKKFVLETPASQEQQEWAQSITKDLSLGRRYDAVAALAMCVRFGSVEFHKPRELMKAAKELGIPVIEVTERSAERTA